MKNWNKVKKIVFIIGAIGLITHIAAYATGVSWKDEPFGLLMSITLLGTVLWGPEEESECH